MHVLNGKLIHFLHQVEKQSRGFHAEKQNILLHSFDYFYYLYKKKEKKKHDAISNCIM